MYVVGMQQRIDEPLRKPYGLLPYYATRNTVAKVAYLLPGIYSFGR